MFDGLRLGLGERLLLLLLLHGLLFRLFRLLRRFLDVGHAGGRLAANRRRLLVHGLLGGLALRLSVAEVRLSHELGRRLGSARALGWAERLVLELLQLGIVGAVLALELEMLPYCLVEDAHKPVPWGS